VSDPIKTEWAIHPAAECFPLLTGQEYVELKASIAARGQHEPIKIDRMSNLVLDGRNRLRACQELGIEPKKAFVSPEDAFDYIIDVNHCRRHMDTTQRAAIAAELANLKHGTNRFQPKVDTANAVSTPVLTEAQAAQKMNVSVDTIQRAKQRAQIDPEYHEAAKSGGKAKVRELETQRKAAGLPTHQERRRAAKPDKPAPWQGDSPPLDGPGYVPIHNPSFSPGITKMLEGYAKILALERQHQTTQRLIEPAHIERCQQALRIINQFFEDQTHVINRERNDRAIPEPVPANVHQLRRNG
jgi:hypothetical protein